MLITMHPYFVYHQSMDARNGVDAAVSSVAAAIGEPARTRMLYCLMDGHARTSTELAMVADVTPATASAHLNRLKAENLVKVLSQGRHRYYSLGGPGVARALEQLSVLAGRTRGGFKPSAPIHLRSARSCYDHMAGTLAVSLHNHFMTECWMTLAASGNRNAYDLTPDGSIAFERLGIDVSAAGTQRRRFAYPCLDWSERRPHVGGALGAALLRLALKRNWVAENLDSRALSLTTDGKREMLARFGIRL